MVFYQIYQAYFSHVGVSVDMANMWRTCSGNVQFLPDIKTSALCRRFVVDSLFVRHSYFPASLSSGSLNTRSKSPWISYLWRHCGATVPLCVARVSVWVLPTHSSCLVLRSTNRTEQFRRRTLLLPSVWWVFTGVWRNLASVVSAIIVHNLKYL